MTHRVAVITLWSALMVSACGTEGTLIAPPADMGTVVDMRHCLPGVGGAPMPCVNPLCQYAVGSCCVSFLNDMGVCEHD